MLEAKRLVTSGNVVLWKLDLMEYRELNAVLLGRLRSRVIVGGGFS